MVKSKDVSVSLTTKGDISPQPHIDEERPSTSVDDTKDDSKRKGSRNKNVAAEDDDSVFIPAEVPNPFRIRITLTTTDKIKVALMTIFVLPIRVFLVTFFLFLTWLGCFIGLLGYSEQDLESKPIQGWRRDWREKVRAMIFWAFRTFLIKVEFRGERSPPSEAPILVAGPHSSFYDFATVIAQSPVPSAVIRDETGTAVISTILRFIQPVFVKRSSKESRQTTLTQIKNRATSSQPWSQVVIFAEGTCSNGSVLIKFKQGAFSAGVPVQPVLLRYPNRLNTLTWTWDGPNALKTMWLTTCQWKTKMVIEYLPVYCPSEAERADPTLYAENVRKLMATALGIGTSEFSYDDLRYIDTGDPRQQQHTLVIVKLLKFRGKNSLKPDQLTQDIKKIAALIDQKTSSQQGNNVEASRDEVLSVLEVESTESTRALFDVLQMGEDDIHDGRSEAQVSKELVNLRVLLAAFHLANMDGQSAFKCLCNDDQGTITQSAFCRLCWCAMQIPAVDSRALYHYLKANLTAETFRQYLIKYHDRCKGVTYFDGAKRVVVEAESANNSTSNGSIKQQKAE